MFEHTGEATWQKSVRALALGGNLVTCGATTGYNGAIDIRYLFAKQIGLLGSTMGTRAELLEILQHISTGRLKATVDKVLPLSEGRHAQELLSSRKFFGKIVLEM